MVHSLQLNLQETALKTPAFLSHAGLSCVYLHHHPCRRTKILIKDKNRGTKGKWYQSEAEISSAILTLPLKDAVLKKKVKFKILVKT